VRKPASPPTRAVGASGFGPRCLPAPGMDRAGAEHEWTLEGNKAHGRIGCRLAGNGDATPRTRSTEQGLEVGRSRRLEGSARPTSVVPGVSGVVRGFGRVTARGWRFRALAAKSGSWRRAGDVLPRSGLDCDPVPVASAYGWGGSLRDSGAGSPVPGRPGDVGVRGFRGSELHRTRDDGPCSGSPRGFDRVGGAAAPGSPGPSAPRFSPWSPIGRAGNGKKAKDPR
jgi:hypothetical protein